MDLPTFLHVAGDLNAQITINITNFNGPMNYGGALMAPMAMDDGAPMAVDDGAPMDVDGAPMDVDDDGAPMDISDDDDAGGAPMDVDDDGAPMDVDGAPMDMGRDTPTLSNLFFHMIIV
jgi:hypothetical protein